MGHHGKREKIDKKILAGADIIEAVSADKLLQEPRNIMGGVIKRSGLTGRRSRRIGNIVEDFFLGAFIGKIQSKSLRLFHVCLFGGQGELEEIV